MRRTTRALVGITLFGFLLLCGCAAKMPASELDWSPKVGELTFTQARAELGVPEWCSPQSGGGMVCVFPARAAVSSAGWELRPVLLFGRDGKLRSGGWRHLLRGAESGPELNPYGR